MYRYVNDTKKGSCICVTALFYRFTNYNKNTPKDDFGQKLPKVDMKGGGGGEGVDKRWIIPLDYDYVMNSLWLLFSAGMHVDSYCSGITSQSCVISSIVCRLDVEPAEEIIYLFFNDG